MKQQNNPDGTQHKEATEQMVGSAMEEAAKKLEHKVLLAKAVLFWEELWPKISVLLAIIGMFIILSLFGFWSFVPSFIHWLGVLGFAIATLWAVVQIMRAPVPKRKEALRQIDKASELPHRPASSFDDSLAEVSGLSKKTASSLWITHKLRGLKLVERFKAGWPKASLERFDPFAMRALMMMLLLFGFAMHGPNSWQQIKSSLSFSPEVKREGIRIDAWLTPPSFTGKNPVMLSDGSVQLMSKTAKAEGVDETAKKLKPIEILENSELVIRIIGKEAGRYSVRQVFDKKTAHLLPFDINKKADNGERDQTNSSLKKLSFSLKKSSTIEILEGTKVIQSWPITVLADLAPAISLSKNPEKTARSALLLTYQIADDFGVTLAQAKVLHLIKKPTAEEKQKSKLHFESAQKEKPLGEPVTFDLKLPVASLKRGEAKTYKDLTAHPWAGLPVQMQLEAHDQGGKVGRSELIAFKLPERDFKKSTARALIELRRYLVVNPSDYGLVARGLDMLSEEAKKLKIDQTAYLSMRDIYWQIRHMQYKMVLPDLRERVKAIVAQMWETALRIEDGNLSKAERDLRRAQDKLADAISRNASPEEIERLMKELRQALGRYMQARRQQQKGQTAQNMTPQELGKNGPKNITAGDLNEMLKRIEQMAKTGSKDAAQQMLNQLRDMLEGLQSPGQQSANNAQSKKMMELMDKFGKLAEQQQKLQEKTFELNRKNMQPQGENNRFGRYKRFERQRPWNNPRQFGNRFGQTPQSNPYYRRNRSGKQGQFGRGQGNQGKNEQGLRGQDGMGKNNLGRPGRKGGDGRFTQGRERLVREQRGLQRQLDNLMNELGRMGGAVPRQLDKARQQMGKAGQELGRGELGGAGQQQGKALESLRKGAKQMAKEMMKRMNRRFSRNGRDPLGRQRGNNGFDPGMDVKVPDEIDTQRAREILEELRRRLGEVKRSPAELDYLESLIKRF